MWVGGQVTKIISPSGLSGGKTRQRAKEVRHTEKERGEKEQGGEGGRERGGR